MIKMIITIINNNETVNNYKNDNNYQQADQFLQIFFFGRPNQKQ
jgi:hypothetical protein